MTRIAIVGANGQVGTEVCLRLREAADVEVVPVVRNLSGSAFLRLNGVDCRHGRIADPEQARHLIGDCDVVVNFALSNTAIPRIDRGVNRQLVRSVVAAAKPGTPIVFASTIMVYAPGTKLRIPDSYGLEKLLSERMFRRLCRASNHPAFVFRLGHVMGDLQNITQKIRAEIQDGKVALPHDGRCASNTVFTATIVEAILQVAHASAKPGTYDLITHPQWSWLQVYRYYAAQLAVPLRLAHATDVRDSKPGLGGPSVLLKRLLHYLANHHALTERLTFLLAFLPHSVNQRVYLRYLQTRAQSQINAMRQSQRVAPCVEDWRELPVRAFGQLPDPETSINRYPLRCAFGYSRGKAAERSEHSK